ncbi:MAG: MOSC domain-containing protein [Candidatus Acidiferrum sp.]
MAQVVGLFRAPRRGAPMEELPEAEAVQDLGFEGCAHGRPGGKRQVLLVDRETLNALELAPGIIRENITTEGLNVNGLKEGESLRIGEVLLEVTMVCTPCSQMDELRQGLRKEIRGRRGMLCRIVRGGKIRQGDAIEKLAR